jgi:hypothetical protein
MGDDSYEDRKHAVETLSVAEACMYIIYELRKRAVASSTALRLIREVATTMEQQQELLILAAENAHQTLVVIDELLVERLVPRLRVFDDRS